MQDGKYAAVVTLRCSLEGGTTATSTFSFTITVEDMGRNEVNNLVYNKAKELTFVSLVNEHPNSFFVPESAEKLKADILFMSIEPE